MPLNYYEWGKLQRFDPNSYRDNLTPAEIQDFANTASNLESFLEFILSQIKQITGEKEWSDPVITSLKDLVENRTLISAKCLNTDSVGDCVYARPLSSDNNYKVSKVNPDNVSKMPAVGMIVYKENNNCKVQVSGVVKGIYGGMDIRKPLYVDKDGGLTQYLPPEIEGDRMFIQPMGMAISENSLVLSPSSFYARRRG